MGEKISSNDFVFASDIDSSLASFENCKVWLETTNDNITYAKEATQGSGVNVKVNDGESLTVVSSGNSVQTDVSGKITDIIIKVNDGYYFPENYSVTAQNGIRVTRDSYTQLTISGTPTGDVNITLPVATEKTARTDVPNVTGGIAAINGTDATMEYAESENSPIWTSCTDGSTPIEAGIWYVRYKETDTQKASDAAKVEVIAPIYTISADTNSLTFDTQNEGYGSIAGQSVTIRNTGNSKVTLEPPVSLSYDVSLPGNEIEPSQTVTFTVAPKLSLDAGEYNETIEIKTKEGSLVNVNVSFKVNGTLNVSLSASPASILEGQSADLTASVEGGSGTYTYTWYANDVEDPSLQGDAAIVSPTVTTTYKVEVHDTIEGKSAAATVTVVPKRYDLEVPADIAFNQHLGDTNAETKSVNIKNIGNMEVTNISAGLSGTNADAFTLDTKGMQPTLSPNDITTFSVKTDTGLAVGEYTAEIQITGDAGIRETVRIALTVTDHDYEVVVTDPTCTSKGYTTHTCKICVDSFQDSETEILGHDFGEWKVTKEPTTAEKGEKVRKCSRCNTEEKITIPMLDKKPETDTPEKDTPNQNKSNQNNNGVKTGDETNTLLWGFMFIASSIVLLSSLYGKKRNINQ